ncbi:MAG: MFS transporter [Caulobacterales bacterium]
MSGGNGGHQERARPLGFAMLGIYSSGAMVDVVITFALNNLLFFYLTIICGMSGTAAGVVTFLSLVVDAAVDPLLGSFSDNTRSRFGRRHPFLIGSVIPTTVAFLLLFSIPAALHGLTLFAYAMVMSLAFRFGYSAFQVPYLALGAELSDDYHERSTIVGYRVFMAIIATIAATILAYNVFLPGPHIYQRAAYTPLAASFGAILIATGLLAGFGTLSTRKRLHQAGETEGGGVARLVSEMVEIFRNGSFRTLFASALVFFVSQGVAVSLTQDANLYFWQLSTDDLRNLSFAYTGGLTLGIFIAAGLASRLEKRVAAQVGLLIFAAAQFAPVTLRVLGVLPPGAPSLIMLMLAYAALGVAVTIAVIGYQSMMADAADEHEHLFGARREGLYFAGISFSVKASSGLGTLIAGVAIDLIGFPHDIAAKGASAVIAPGILRELALIYGPGAAIATVISTAMLLGYRLNRKAHAKILETLTERRQITGVDPIIS